MAEKRIIFPPQGIRFLHLPIAFVNGREYNTKPRAHAHARNYVPCASRNPRGTCRISANSISSSCVPRLFYVTRARVYSQLWISLNDRTNLCIRPRLPGLHLTVPGLIKETVYPMRYVCSLSRMNKIENSIENRDENVEGDVTCNTRFFNG